MRVFVDTFNIRRDIYIIYVYMNLAYPFLVYKPKTMPKFSKL